MLKINTSSERLNYFNSLTLKQKQEALSEKTKAGIISKSKPGIKTVANKDFMNKLSDLLEQYNEDDESNQRQKNHYPGNFNEKDNLTEEESYPDKVKANKFTDQFKNSLLTLLSDVDKNSANNRFEKINFPGEVNKQSILSIDEITQKYKEMNYDAAQICSVLNKKNNLKIVDIVRALKKVKFNINEIADALVISFDANAEEIAADLKFAFYDADDVLIILCRFYERTSGLKPSFELFSRVSQNLYSSGYQIEETADAFKKHFKLSHREMATILQKGNYPAEDILKVLKNIFHLPADKITEIISQLFHLGKNEIKSLLENAGYPLLTIHSVVDKVLKSSGKSTQFPLRKGL